MTLAYGVLADGGVCARIDGRVVDLSGLDPVFDSASLNGFMARGPDFWQATSARVERGYERRLALLRHLTQKLERQMDALRPHPFHGYPQVAQRRRRLPESLDRKSVV